MITHSGHGPVDAAEHRRFVRINTQRPMIVCDAEDGSLAAEQFRNLAFQIEEEARRAGGGYVLAVTSPEPGAGKTVVSLNLALTLARESEQRILLIECDLRGPSVHTYLEGNPPGTGLWQVLAGEEAAKRAVVSIWGSRLELLLAGTTGQVGNVVAQQPMARLLEQVRSRYDIVVIDSPPLILAGGRSAASRADGTLLVVRAGRTHKRGIDEALSLLGRQKVLGMLLNGVAQPSRRNYYGYYGYGSAATPVAQGRAERLKTRRWLRVLSTVLPLVAVAAGAMLWLLRDRSHEAVLTEPRSPALNLTTPVEAPPLRVPAEPPPFESELPGPSRAVPPTRSTSSTVATGAESAAASAPALESFRLTAAFNLRRGPASDREALAVVEAGATVTVLERRGEWLRVDSGGRQGWLSAVSEPSSAPEPGPEESVDPGREPPETTASGPAPPEPITADSPRPETSALPGEPAILSQPTARETPEPEIVPMVVPPRLLEVPTPRYPPVAERLSLRGRVVIAVLVDPSGRVTQATVVSSPTNAGVLTQSALEAARRARFQPGTEDDIAVPMSYRLSFEFEP